MTDLSRTIGGKVRLRLAVPLIVMMFLSSLDRVNVSFGSLYMNADIGLTPAVYGLGAGIFFIGFLGGQFPSMAVLDRVGLRAWLCLCALLWGACATSMAFLTNPTQYLVLRVILGFAEAGLAPGMVFYLSRWSPDRDRAAAFSAPMLAIPISLVLGAPLSGWLLGVENPLGMANWRWMFLVEGVPTIALAVMAYFYFPDRPEQARWLSDAEKAWLGANSAFNRRPTRTEKEHPLSAFRNPVIWATGGVWFFLLGGAYGIIFWLPQVIRQMSGLNDLEIGLVNALPWIGNGLAIAINAWHSDRTQERFWHVAVPAVVAGAAFMLAAASTGVAALALLFLGGVGLGAAQGAFWAIPTSLLSARTMAAGVVGVNIAGSSAGLIIPNLIGVVRQSSGTFEMPIYLVSGFLILAAVLLAAMRVTAADTFKSAPTPV